MVQSPCAGRDLPRAPDPIYAPKTPLSLLQS